LKHSVSAKSRNSASAGFTLIETLAALAIAGAMFAVIAEFSGRTLRNWHHGEATIAVMEMLTRGLGRLQVDLASAVPMTPPGTDGSAVYFAGNESTLRFVAATGFGAGNRGLELLNIAAEPDHDDVLLVRQRGPVLNPPAQMRDPVVLMRGRIQLRFAYRDAAGQTFKSWTNKPTLPTAVLVQVLGQDGTPVFPTAFVLPVPVSLGADCLGEQSEQTPPRCTGGSNDEAAQGNAAGQPGAKPPTPQTPQAGQ
jgi:prepilin-type N-terminal cleavage/methylation domain-containing protein